MSRREELTRAAARLFAEKGYHGTSVGDLAGALGVQKGSLYSHIDSKADLLWEVAREGAEAFHAALDAVPDEGPVVGRIRLALRGHLRVVAEQLDIATVFVREWRYLDEQPPQPKLQGVPPLRPKLHQLVERQRCEACPHSTGLVWGQLERRP